MTVNAFVFGADSGPMDRVSGAGAALAAASAVGYVVDVLSPYPGRAFTITGVMVGLTLWAVGG